tara:strand:+ start:211 stop:552 length:342 start_codon:yes stop_codon:yes gene_type:complete
LVAEFAQSVTYVGDLLLDYLFKKRSKLGEGGVILVVEPGLDEDTVIWLQLEVLSNIINDYGFRHVTANTTQVFYKHWSMRQRMLTVEPVFYPLFHVDLVQYPISVLQTKQNYL